MPSRIINSADEFTNAIHDGVRLMGAYNATLRTIKRFVNQAKVLTMHLYNDPESGINEKDFVTMTGLHEFDHELLGLIGKAEVEAVAGKIKPIFPDIDQTLYGLMAQCREFKTHNINCVFISWVQGFDIR